MAHAVLDAWRATGYSVTPASAAGVMATLAAIGVHSTGQRFAWRGMSSADYAVESSLQRLLGDEGRSTDEQSVRAVEQDLLDRARRWGLGRGRYGNVDDLQLLADLQHYGVPTRLLDFTWNPMTALWFACQKPSVGSASESGLVLALNVTTYREYTSHDVSSSWIYEDTPWVML